MVYDISVGNDTKSNARPTAGWRLGKHPTHSMYNMSECTPVWRDIVGGMSVLRGRADISSYIVVFSELLQFDLNLELKRASLIYADIPAETVDHLWYDQVLPRLIAHDGTLVLHAGGIAFSNRAIAIMAPTGHGKSTLSASLQSAGHTLLGDDALIVGPDTPPTVHAVYPSLRLLPDSGRAAERNEIPS